MQQLSDQVEKGCIINWANQLNSETNKSENQILKKTQSCFRPNLLPSVRRAEELHLYSCKQIQQTQMLRLKNCNARGV